MRMAFFPPLERFTIRGGNFLFIKVCTSNLSVPKNTVLMPISLATFNARLKQHFTVGPDGE